MADAIEIFTNSASERIEVFTSGAQGPKGDAGGATFDQDLNTTDAVIFASVNAPLYDAELNQSGIEVFNGSVFIRGANGDAELNTEDLTALRSFFFPDESGHVALVENTATAAQGALADTAVQPNTGPSFTGIDVVSDTPMVVVESNSSGKSTAIKDGRIEFSATGNDYVHTLQHGTISAHATFTLPTSTGTLALTSQIPSTFAASAITSGTLDNARINWAAPSAIGGTTAAAGTFTALTVTDGTYTGALNADGANGVLAMRGAAQAFRVYNTYTSSTNYERGFFKWSGNVLQIGTEKGSGGGTARALEFLTDGVVRGGFDTSGNFSANILLGANKAITFGNGFTMLDAPATAGVLRIYPFSGSSVRIQLGGNTASYPAIYNSGTTIQAVLANNTATFTAIQGKLTTDTNAAAGTITPDKTLTLYDAAGTAYKVPCVAA